MPVRAESLEFPATLIVTVPLPPPEEPDATAIHGTVGVALQVQVLPALTVIVAAPPAAGTDCAVGWMTYVHGVGPGDGAGGVGVAPDCVTTNDRPAIAMAPWRLTLEEFGAAVKRT